MKFFIKLFRKILLCRLMTTELLRMRLLFSVALSVNAHGIITSAVANSHCRLLTATYVLFRFKLNVLLFCLVCYFLKQQFLFQTN